jgi:UDP-glucuronate 4-epimerase
MGGEPILVTGAAGFIGFHVCRRLLRSNHTVVGLDNLNDYYDPTLKVARLQELHRLPNFVFVQRDLANTGFTAALFSEYQFSRVIHLAAQAGVRYSLVNPQAYLDSNLQAFLNVLEGCRRNSCRHLLYASSSSVYGANRNLPFSVHRGVDHPISLYAATKKANELMAHSYSYLFGLPTTGMRFFTVYGPWGRPDMAMFLFAQAILKGLPLRLFNNGNMRRDFTYVDDVSDVIERLLDFCPSSDVTWDSGHPDPATSPGPWRVYNIGNDRSVEVGYVVELLEKELGAEAIREMAPMQPGDVAETRADIDDLVRDVGFRPRTTIEVGIKHFVSWFKEHYH